MDNGIVQANWTAIGEDGTAEPVSSPIAAACGNSKCEAFGVLLALPPVDYLACGACGKTSAISLADAPT